MTACDVIVIGGGHNGLVTAALLAGRGRKVTVLERHAVLGGLAVGDEFHPGFTSAGLLHDTSGVNSRLIEELGLQPLTAEPPPVLTPQPPDDGPGLLLHRDAGRAAGEIETHSAADARRYGEYRALLGRLRPFTSRLFDREPPAIAGDGASLWGLTGRAVSLRRLGRSDMMELLRITPMALADWLGEWFESELLRSTLALPAIAGTRTGPRSPGNVANLLRLDAMAGGAVTGGPAAFIEALADAAQQRCVDIRTDAEVRHVRTSGDGVAGVTLADGETIDAPVVAASCDPKQVFLKLVDPAVVTPTLNHHVDKLRGSGTTAKVDLAVSRPLRFACRPDLDVERAHVVTTIDDMERAFDATKYGRCSEHPLLDVYVPTGHAPDGHCVVSVVTHFAPHDLVEAWTDAARERLGDTVVETLARYAPDLPGQVVARRVLTPVDIETRYGVTGGHIHHVEHALDQMVVRPVPQCARYATPIRGLYLCGSGSHPGGGLTGGPGMLAAAVIVKAGIRVARSTQR